MPHAHQRPHNVHCHGLPHCPIPVGEHDPVAEPGIQTEDVRDQAVVPVEPAAQVIRLEGEMDPGRAADGQHGSASTSSRTRESGTPGARTRVTPEGMRIWVSQERDLGVWQASRREAGSNS